MAGRTHRRVRTEPVPGVDPSPQLFPDGRAIDAELAAEDRLGAWGDDEGPEVLPDAAAASNAERLERDRPPHYA
ncbi:hypothetical protein GCM10011490_11280 [Pseudoclavibacter endophyticus]|uniref:Uncharacterized protein n=1 Tax=Pseudoclavibacter endophyticus TaxID=1778590 RepID=A0A6H9WRP7_9MICO|nr:hypothetical protein [Pseudoclavibacter endophyticus]KAB1649445.1 hypothetical protein F8O04_04050 [Pseudoclavibacter endophyticus]GGA62608.1 hypothetical protein GCM10011490_11280 [Pseudoclavibacter endophyticus]